VTAGGPAGPAGGSLGARPGHRHGHGRGQGPRRPGKAPAAGVGSGFAGGEAPAGKRRRGSAGVGSGSAAGVRSSARRAAAAGRRAAAAGAGVAGERTRRPRARPRAGLLQYLGARICGAELGAEIYGADLFFFFKKCHVRSKGEGSPGPRRRDPWRRDVIPRRHDAWRRPPGSISAFKFSRGPIVNFFQKKGQIVKNWGVCVSCVCVPVCMCAHAGVPMWAILHPRYRLFIGHLPICSMYI